MMLRFQPWQCRLTAALPLHFVFARRCWQISLRLDLIRFQAFFSIFKAVTLLFALAKLKPVAECFFEPETRTDKEEPC